MKKYVVEDEAGSRIDKYICNIEKELTRVAVQRMMATGKITVNNGIVKPSYKIAVGDEIDIEEEMPEETEMKPQDIPLDIVYEDDEILVINKEKGMVVHPREWERRRNPCKRYNVG